jgi:hypothetical protein
VKPVLLDPNEQAVLGLLVAEQVRLINKLNELQQGQEDLVQYYAIKHGLPANALLQRVSQGFVLVDPTPETKES